MKGTGRKGSSREKGDGGKERKGNKKARGEITLEKERDEKGAVKEVSVVERNGKKQRKKKNRKSR